MFRNAKTAESPHRVIQYIMDIVIMDIVIILPQRLCPRANPIQILLVIVISLLDIVIVLAPIIQKYWIIDLLWPL